MLWEDYVKIRDTISTDRAVPPLFRLAEGTTLLTKLLQQGNRANLEGGSVSSSHDVIFVGGPRVAELTEEEATRLSTLGFRIFEEEFGFQFST